MRILLLDGIVDRANQRYSNDPFAEVFVSASGTRSLRSQIVPFGTEPLDLNSRVRDGNPDVFEMDADALGALPNGTAINAGARFIAEGVMSYSCGECGDKGTPTDGPLKLKLERLSASIGSVLGLPDVLATGEVEKLAVLQQPAAQFGAHAPPSH